MRRRKTKEITDVRLRLAVLSVFATAASANGELHPKERKRLQALAEEAFEAYPPQWSENWLDVVDKASVSLEDCAELLQKLPEEGRG